MDEMSDEVREGVGPVERPIGDPATSQPSARGQLAGQFRTWSRPMGLAEGDGSAQLHLAPAAGTGERSQDGFVCGCVCVGVCTAVLEQ